MPVRSFGPITVVGPPIRTFIEVRRGDLIDIRASGTVDFGGAFLGIGAPVLGPDGENWPTPPDYPAPDLRKNSLIVGVRSATYPFSTLWFQGGANRSFSSPVDGFLSLAANDGLPDDNTRGWTVNFSITTPERFGSSSVRLSIGRIEFVQSMQRTDNSVPLVAFKRTLVRVFVNSGRPDPDPVPVTGTMEVQRPDGATFTMVPIAPGTAVPEGTQNRNDIASSLNFILPPSATGTVRVRMRVNVPDRATEAGSFTEERSSAEFISPPIITIQPYLIGLPTPGLSPPTSIQALTILTQALQRLPIADGSGVLPFTIHSYLLPFGDVVSWRNLLYTVGDVLSQPGVARIGEPGEREFIQVAFIKLFARSALGGIALGRPWLIPPSAVVSLSENPEDADLDAARCAHEIGHALGLFHAQCRNPPIPHDSHLPRSTEEPGWYAAFNEMVPQGTPEMMSYCRPRWPSITAYEYILNGRFD